MFSPIEDHCCVDLFCFTMVYLGAFFVVGECNTCRLVLTLVYVLCLACLCGLCCQCHVVECRLMLHEFKVLCQCRPLKKKAQVVPVPVASVTDASLTGFAKELATRPVRIVV